MLFGVFSPTVSMARWVAQRPWRFKGSPAAEPRAVFVSMPRRVSGLSRRDADGGTISCYTRSDLTRLSPYLLVMVAPVAVVVHRCGRLFCRARRVVSRSAHFREPLQSALPLGRVDDDALPMRIVLGHWSHQGEKRVPTVCGGCGGFGPGPARWGRASAA